MLYSKTSIKRCMYLLYVSSTASEVASKNTLYSGPFLYFCIFHIVFIKLYEYLAHMKYTLANGDCCYFTICRYKREGKAMIIPNFSHEDAGDICCDVTVFGDGTVITGHACTQLFIIGQQILDEFVACLYRGV